MRPSSSGPARTGRVMSARSLASLADRAARSSAALRPCKASLTRCLRPLTAWPKLLRSAVDSEASRPISSATRPRRPSAALRASSRALRSPAASISARSAPSSAAMSLSCAIAVIRGALRRCTAARRRGRSELPRQPRRSLRRFELRGGLLAQRLEPRGILDGKVGQHLAVDGNAGLVEAVDKAPVGHAVLAHRGIDALDPQGTEGPLLALAVAVAVLQRLFDRLFGNPNGVLAAAIVALGLLQGLLVLGMGGDAALDACHGNTPSGIERCLELQLVRRGSAVVGHVFLDDAGIAIVEHHGAACVAHKFCRALDHAVPLSLGLRLYLACTRHFEAFLGTALGLELGHFALLIGTHVCPLGAAARLV